MVNAAVDPMAPKKPHFAPKAKNVIFLYMSGGVSQVDTFEHKPALQKYAGQRLPVPKDVDGEIRSFLERPHGAVPAIAPFRQCGQSGMYLSTMFEHLPKVVDDLAFIHAIKGDSNNHSPATLHINTGSILQGSPSVGAWATYGLGSENRNLPGFIVLHDPRGGPVNGPAVWNSGYLPASYQGTAFRPVGTPVLNLDSPQGVTREQARRELDFLQALNREHAAQRTATDDLEARIASYELAYRMQMEAPQVVDLNLESRATRELYGIDDPVTGSFGRQCLMARRLVEKGVRFVLLVHGWENGTFSWDHHSDIERLLPARINEIDRPVSALLTDLKQRGLFDDTVVVWTSEMGRTPFNEGSGRARGRNHNQWAMLSWMAGAGIAPGAHAGAMDDFGLKGADKQFHVRDLHATILHLLGLDQMALTYLHEGRNKRLTDTGGEVIREILRA
ncbi:MAG: DUF1501 domain-containing protein [Candidatus Solibacter usitatus]|nr:DUF1501 domain-containing protein [Candidatus Solibacter usitatus]